MKPVYPFLCPVVALHRPVLLLRQLDSPTWVMLYMTVPFRAATVSAVRDFKASCMLRVPYSTGLTGELIAALIYTQVLCSKAPVPEEKLNYD